MARINRSSGTKPTATVIAPNFIVTAAHWSKSYSLVGKYVSLGTENSDDYIIVDERLGEYDGSSYSPDIAVYRVKKVDPNDPNNPDPNEDANFSDWVDLYSNSDEVGKLLTIGSYGPQRWYGYPDPPIEPAGTLHWGRNVVRGADSTLYKVFDAIGEDDYVKYEVNGGMYDSGAGWFIKDGIEWKLAGLYTSVMARNSFGPRISLHINWIDQQIANMNGVRPLPDLADVHWQGADYGDWAVAGNWDTSSIPNSSDRVAIDNGTTAVISSPAAAKELFVGIDNGGSVSQSGGTMAIEIGRASLRERV